MKKTDYPTAAATKPADTGTVAVVLKRDHWHRGLLMPAATRLDLLPRQAAALKAAGVAE